ncbi:hypothetical protein FOCC_FOCC012650 [Frankliniella occidentalis]|nr:hypothetical protein FOCC_FOCC012650 [Frankliniella occidentalis]
MAIFPSCWDRRREPTRRRRPGRPAPPRAAASQHGADDRAVLPSTSEVALRRSPRKSASTQGVKKKKGPYQPNTPSHHGRLSKAIKVREGGTSIRQACYIYNQTRTTLAEACRRRVFRPAGRSTELTEVEEEALVAHLLCQFDWGFPLTRMDGEPATNILNFDETNVMDDPANNKIIVRGEKYPVKVMTTSKTPISLIFAGTSSGTLLPPFVVYESKELFESCTTGGPPGARYHRSPSGWFDKIIFEEWFRTTAETVDGVKVGIGDNVSYHFNKAVFDLCAEHNIKFVYLPPNSTHLLQPLDVTFVSPLKNACRNILNDRKQKSRNKTLTQPSFPRLLKKLMDAIEGKHSDTSNQSETVHKI